MKRSLLAWTVLALFVMALGTGCRGTLSPTVTHATPTQRGPATLPASATPHDPEPEVNVTATPTPQAPQPGLSVDAQALFARAREDLTRRTGLSHQAIRLVSVESVQWPDASLGCPQPDRMYAQVITPGFRVVLRAAGEVYTYHADRGERLILCEEGSKPGATPPPSPIAPGLERLASQARDDLAARLSIPIEQIEVIEAKPVVWPDGSLGCPDPDKAYLQVTQEGVLIRLRAGPRIYSYHGGAGRPPFLCEQATTSALE